MQIGLGIRIFVSFEIPPSEVELLEHAVVRFLRILRPVSLVAAPIHQPTVRAPFSPHPCQPCYLLVFRYPFILRRGNSGPEERSVFPGVRQLVRGSQSFHPRWQGFHQSPKRKHFGRRGGVERGTLSVVLGHWQ